MAGTSWGSTPLKRISIGPQPIRRISLGTVLVWTDRPDPAGIDKDDAQALDPADTWVPVIGYTVRAGFPLTRHQPGGFIASSDGSMTVEAQITWQYSAFGTHRTAVIRNGAVVLEGETGTAVSTVSGTIAVSAGDVIGLAGLFTYGNFGGNVVTEGSEATFLTATPI